MAKKKRTKAKRESDLVVVAEMYFKGATQYEIGKKLGLTQQQISYDIKQLQERWMGQAMAHITEGKAQQLGEIDHLERQAWQAWEDSRGEVITTTVKRQALDEDDDGGLEFEHTKRTEFKAGDASYLRVIEYCINKRCEILGLDSGPISKHLNINFSELSDQQIDRLAEGEDLISVITNPGPS